VRDVARMCVCACACVDTRRNACVVAVSRFPRSRRYSTSILPGSPHFISLPRYDTTSGKHVAVLSVNDRVEVLDVDTPHHTLTSPATPSAGPIPTVATWTRMASLDTLLQGITPLDSVYVPDEADEVLDTEPIETLGGKT
jgi:hypothetical protein